jgi:hypothetical protein
VLGKRLGGVAAVLVLALCALPSSVALGGEGEDEGASTLFSVKASRGYEAVVSAQSERDDGRGEVSILLFDRSHRHVAYYQGKGIVTDTTLKAEFGVLGRIDLTLRRSGKEGTVRAPAPCNGSMGGYEKATYRGRFVFRGEEGFTTVRAKRIAVSPQGWANLVCSNHFEVESKELEPGAVGATLAARYGITITRTVGFLADAASFDYDSSFSSASVDLPAPFSGSAVYRRDARPAERWVGNLSVDLPGRANVSLVRPDVGTTLLPAVWSVEGPEFE